MSARESSPTSDLINLCDCGNQPTVTVFLLALVGSQKYCEGAPFGFGLRGAIMFGPCRSRARNRIVGRDSRVLDTISKGLPFLYE